MANVVSMKALLEAGVQDVYKRQDYDRASELLGQLLKKQEEPIMILGVISKELRRLYTARLALDSRKDKLWLMDLWNMRSDYPAPVSYTHLAPHLHTAEHRQL